MILKVEQLTNKGYQKCQPNILDYMKSKGLNYLNVQQTLTQREDLLSKRMLVKADKPNSCYTYADLLCNLDEMKATDLATALKCGVTDLNCNTA